MNREDFLRQFREALEGKVPEQVINENIFYYGNYISSQVNGGKSEHEVLHALGDPRLLAKTIEESCKFSGGTGGAKRNSYGGSYSSANNYGQDRYGSYGNDTRSTNRRITTIPAWLVALLAVIIFVFLITVVFNVFMFFLPVIIVGFVAMIVYKLIRFILK